MKKAFGAVCRASFLAGIVACGEGREIAQSTVATSTHLEYCGACEDQCGECETYNRCAVFPGGTVRFHCVTGGCGCRDSTPVACMCCDDNQILVGGIRDGHCEDCPPGQVAEKLTGGNFCCTPRTQQEVCGNQCNVTLDDGCVNMYNCACPSGLSCVGGTCSCVPLTQQQACGNKHCGTVSDGCGGTYSCGGCALNQYCGTGNYCYCSWPYRNCEDPLPARPRCLKTCP